jgi:hypothetical protein
MSRIEEAIQVMKQVNSFGFPSEYPPLKELSKRLSDYVKTGQGWSGIIKFKEYNRYADIILPSKPSVPIQVVLKFKKYH